MEKQLTYRTEQDSIGTKKVPENVYYGVQTLRAAENFRITGLNMHPEIINSLAYIKKAAAITNCEVGILDSVFAMLGAVDGYQNAIGSLVYVTLRTVETALLCVDE
jgi:aspartate ammonia-lyase